MSRAIHPFRSHGSGQVDPSHFAAIGSGVVFEPGVLVFHPESICLGSNIYIGHQTILHGYPNSQLRVGSDTWIGPQCYLHSGGGLSIGERVGIGPGVRIFTSSHREEGAAVPILYSDLEFSEVIVEDDCDIGVGAIVLPGSRIGKGALVGAGSVVTREIPSFTVVAGVPARELRRRNWP